MSPILTTTQCCFILICASSIKKQCPCQAWRLRITSFIAVTAPISANMEMYIIFGALKDDLTVGIRRRSIETDSERPSPLVQANCLCSCTIM